MTPILENQTIHPLVAAISDVATGTIHRLPTGEITHIESSDGTVRVIPQNRVDLDDVRRVVRTDFLIQRIGESGELSESISVMTVCRYGQTEEFVSFFRWLFGWSKGKIRTHCPWIPTQKQIADQRQNASSP